MKRFLLLESGILFCLPATSIITGIIKKDGKRGKKRREKDSPWGKDGKDVLSSLKEK